uniref:complex III assembly factor LYRM7 n=1 Tax=Myxine glutinosa TaxID=7769 RepID=UPI00358ECD62
MAIRRKVLSLFRDLHRIRKDIFREDEAMLRKIRIIINEEFRKNAGVTTPEKVDELVQMGKEVGRYLKSTIIQCDIKANNNLRLRITEDHLRDNVPNPPNIT